MHIIKRTYNQPNQTVWLLVIYMFESCAPEMFCMLDAAKNVCTIYVWEKKTTQTLDRCMIVCTVFVGWSQQF